MRTRVLVVNAGADTGGVAYGISSAFTRHAPEWGVRSLIRSTNYIDYPHDLVWESKTLREEWRSAEVLHYFSHWRTAALYERRFGQKPTVIHYHGTGFREDPKAFLIEQRRRGAIGLVSTLDLWLLAPDETEWLPAPYDVNWLHSMADQRGGDHIRIAHAPTQRAIKSTDAFLAACERLKAEGHPIIVDLIERTSWRECLERKARADIYFDQVTLGYGCNAIEAWGMGMPVIAGAADDTLYEMVRRFGYLPFYRATEDSIYEALLDLIESDELRKRYADLGLAFVKGHHDGEHVVEQLKGIYSRLTLQAAA